LPRRSTLAYFAAASITKKISFITSSKAAILLHAGRQWQQQQQQHRQQQQLQKQQQHWQQFERQQQQLQQLQPAEVSHLEEKLARNLKKKSFLVTVFRFLNFYPNVS
jgi:hypothetical protein